MMHSKRPFYCFVLLITAFVFFGLTCLGLYPVTAATVPPGFTETTIPGPAAGNWTEAVGISFEDNGRMYVWERTGRVWFKDPTDSSFTLLLDIREEVGDWEDHGMLGFALHPDFRVNGYIYVLYVVDRHHLLNFGTGSYNPSANAYNNATIGRLTRYTCRSSDGFRSVDTASRFVMIGETRQTGFPVLSYTHGIGSLVFGEDGTLLVSCGDGATADTVDDGGSISGSYAPQGLTDGIIKTKENIGAYRSQLVDCLNGKVLRINPLNGEGVPSNPFYDSVNPRAPRSRVWALGLRNPFRISVKPESGSHSPDEGRPGILYIGDVGWNQRESLRVITGPGQNAGWPMYEGLEPMGGYEGAVFNRDAPNPLYPASGCSQFFTFAQLFKPDTLNPAQQPPFVNPCNASQRIPVSIPQFLHTRPVLDWDHSADLTRTPTYDGSGNGQIAEVGAPGSPVSGSGFNGNCAVGGAWYTGTAFAPQYQNSYYFADWGQQVVKRLTFDANERPVALDDFMSNAGAVVCIVQHPFDGSLYYVSYTFGDAGTVRKLSYTGNRTPVAVAFADQSFGVSPLTVQFSSVGTADPDGQALSYLWDFGDGSPTSTLPSPAHIFNAAAGIPTSFTVRLTVTDTGGLSAQATLVVSVNNTPPEVAITSPATGATYSLSGPTTINLAADVSDSNSANNELTYEWQVLLHHNTHNHVVLTETTPTASAILSPIGCDGINIYYYRVILTVADPHGLKKTTEARVYPACPTPNTPPVISDVADQTILIGSAVGPLAFTIGDSGVLADNLELSGTSSNPSLVPQSGIVFGGSASNRTVTVFPAPNQNGTATITITVGDGPLTASDSFQLTVTGNNTPPTISQIPNQATPESTPSAPINFTVGDLEVPVSALTVSGTSSNPTLVPPSSFVFSGSGASRTLTITPAPNLNGTATITVSVNDGQYSTSTNFLLTVSGVAAAGTRSFTNSAPITIPSSGNATPYGSPITVTSMGGTITNVTVTLRNFSHSWPADADVLLVGPGGQSAMILSDVGGGNSVNGVTVTLADSAASALTTSSQITTGTYKPSDVEPGETGNLDTFSPPAPAGPYTSALSVFRTLPANGVWSLYVVDDGPGDQGGIAGGWSLTITTVGGGPASPTISDITDKSTTVDVPTAAIGFTVGDADTAATSLTVSGSSSNPTLVPNGNIVFGGSGANRTVTLTPAAGQIGTATITVTVSDGALTASDTFVLTVNAVNTAPTISDIAAQNVNEDTGSGAIAFTVGDGQSAPGSLAVSGSSDNAALVPNGNIVFGGSGANRTVTVTPAANQSGTATITVSVSDGQFSTSDTFMLTVNAVNDAPTISNIPDQTTTPGTAVGPISFTVGDVESLASLTVGGSSSNPTVVPNGNIVFGGSGASRTVTVTPASGQSGTATITVTVSDGLLSATDTFVLTVSTATSGTASFTNATAIVIPHVGAATPYPSVINVSGMAGTISEVVVRLNGFYQSWPDDIDVLLVGPGGQKAMLMSDVGGGNGVSGVNLTLRDSAAAALTRSGTLASGTFKPTDFPPTDTFTAPAPAGPYTTPFAVFNGSNPNGAWSVYAMDDGPGDQGGFAGGWSLTITTVGGGPASPTISDITDKSTTVDVPTAAIGFTIGDADTPATSLTVAGSSSNPTLIPNANIVFAGTSSNRTVTLTPAAGQIGTATITVTVSDGALTAADTFVLTVNAVNTAPTISDIPAQNVNEDTGSGAISFTVGDGQSAPGSLSVSGSSDNPALVPNANIVFGGSGANRTVTVTAAANQSGVATITVSVSDGQFSTSDTFVLTVNAVNDAPTISNIPDQTTTPGTAVGPISFTVGDVESLASLVAGGSSSNPTLVPNGNIVFGGSGASRTVTVTPASGQSGTATITVNVSDGLLSATDTFVLTVSTATSGTASFTNAAAIVIPHVGAATPYPSVINVSGMAGTISEVVVRLNGFYQSWPDDVDVLLVGPAGQKAILMSDVGGGNSVSGVNLTLRDSAAAGLTRSGTLASGTFKPTDFELNDTFTVPAPAGPYTTPFSVFNGSNPNGAWSVYAMDDGPGDEGGIAGGWSLTVTTTLLGPAGSNAAVPTISIVGPDSTGEIILTVTAGPNEICDIEASKDMISWHPVGTVQSESGISLFKDWITNERSRLFYRVVSQP